MDALPLSHLGSQNSLDLHLDENQQLSAHKGSDTLWNISHSLSSLSISSLSLAVLPLSLSSGGILFPSRRRIDPAHFLPGLPFFQENINKVLSSGALLVL